MEESASPNVTTELIRVATTVGEHYYESAAAVGLSVQEARLLFILAVKPTNMLGLRSALRVPKSTMTGLMSRMEFAGLIERSTDVDDARQIVATPTRLGTSAAAAFIVELRTRVEGVLSALDRTEQRELGGIFSEMLSAVESGDRF
jgi:MarR family transcriptional regulator, lower aerobic nicotinate degradation pathway regulator